MDSAQFKYLTDQLFNGLKMNPINSCNIKEIIANEYEYLKENIRKMLKTKIVCLKIDSASSHCRSVLGINVQYYEEKKLNILTLGMIELHNRHTAINLCSGIQSVLEDFDLTQEQIQSVTSDDGRNMIKAIEILSNEPNTFELESDLAYEDMVNDVKVHNIISIRCAAHTLQLAVNDF